MPKIFLSSESAAKRLGVSVRKFQKMVAEGLIRSVVSGGSGKGRRTHFFLADEISQFKRKRERRGERWEGTT